MSGRFSRPVFAVLAAALLFLSGAGAPLDADPRIESVQARLAERGFDPGPVDGVMGPRTRRALKAFQRARDLEPDGRLGPITWKALSVNKSAPAAKKSAAGAVIAYAALDWRPPQSGAEALSRFRRQTGSPEMARSGEELVVPRGDSVYVVAAGETVPGFDCDPLNGRVEMEIMLGRGGPVVFRPLDQGEYCRLGFGILLEVGQRLKLSVAGGTGDIDPGVVEVSDRGLRYVRAKP